MGKSDENAVHFFINGQRHAVNPETSCFPLDTPLVDFIRDTANLKGTKSMCREGGCGACVVTLKTKDPATGLEITKAVNSCLTPVLTLNNCEVTTVEGVGNKADGYHKIQERLAKFNATQCGFCSPGMVMNMYSLMNSKEKVTVQDVHDSFDGNICRCTGYRPILDAFKSFAVDAPENLRQQCKDIEDCGGCPSAKGIRRNGGCCNQQASPVGKSTSPSSINFKLSTGEEWVQATDLGTALANLHRFAKEGKKCRIVAGNTGTGVFKNDGPYEVFLDINNIPDLKVATLEPTGVVLGAGTTLTSAITLLLDASKLPGYEYTAKMSKHLERVANVPVRNNGTLAGNLMMKHAHHDFPSDVFLILEAVAAEVNIVEGKWCHNVKSLLGGSTKSRRVSVLGLLDTDMTGKLITSIHLRPWQGNYIFRSFKITRRYQNAHAYVNAAFLLNVEPQNSFKIMEQPRILFGGINLKFTHATEAEKFLNGKFLTDSQTLRGLMEVLNGELSPDFIPPEASPEYRKNLAKGLLYKTILGIIGTKSRPQLKSGGEDLQRGISSGQQTHDKSNEHVLYQNLHKIEAVVQASGEAEYVNDIPPRPDELFGAMVLSTVANADLKCVDASEALKIPGVVAFVSEKDIPGLNNYACYSFLPFESDEKVFAKDKVLHAGQAIGLIVAKSSAIAELAAKKVQVTYANQTKPVLDMAESLQTYEAAGILDKFCMPISKSQIPASTTGSRHTIKGEFRIGSQYHFHMETHAVICVPKEDGMDIYSTTQWMDHVQIVVAATLGIPTHNVNVEVRRLGGSFGGKITRATHLAAICAVAANAVRKPVRIVLPLETNMRMMGMRNPYLSRYEAGFDDSGKIESLSIDIFCDPGSAPTEQDAFVAQHHVQNVYNANTGWKIRPGFLLTDKPSNTSCRAPGTTEGAATIEWIMEHIAHKVGKDPLEVRLLNFMKKGDQIITHGKELESDNICVRMIEEIKVSGDYDRRKKSIATFNQENRWKKRGLSLVPVRYELEYFGMVKQPVSVVAHHYDGYVSVSHGGIEMGQGLNTKVAQTVAHTLQIPLEKIKIRPSNTFVGCNAFVTGGSTGSEICCGAAKVASEILLKRMEPIKETLEDKSWENVVKTCFNANMDLYASYLFGPNDKVEEYNIWVVNLTEVEVDVLTGEYKVVRVDIVEDAGKSLNPGIDIGQIEGAHIMGQGLWTTEKLVYDEATGQLLTNSTWDYKPPESKDIPEDFRVTLLSNAPNPAGVLRSKATGEPPLVASVAVFLAIKHAIDEARKDAGNTDWYQLDGPVTPEDILHHALTTSSQFAF